MKYVEAPEEIYFEFETQGRRVKVPVEFRGRHKIGGKQDLLAKAIGKKANQTLKVLDLTAGLGRDAFHMAQLGCKVVALERHPLLAKALQSAWERGQRDENLCFVQADARAYLCQISPDAEIIFYDPMFPEKKKSALAGKESQLLQLLTAGKTDENEQKSILSMAIKVATGRVVVKRPLSAPAILPSPDVVFKGKSIRYDVYLALGRDSRRLHE